MIWVCMQAIVFWSTCSLGVPQVWNVLSKQTNHTLPVWYLTWHDVIWYIIPDCMIPMCYATQWFDLFWFKHTSMQCTTSSWDVLKPRYHSNIGYWYRHACQIILYMIWYDAIWCCWVWHTIYMVQFDMIWLWYDMMPWYVPFHSIATHVTYLDNVM